MSIERIAIRWDDYMGCYRVDVPNWDGGVVVRAEDHDAVVASLQAQLISFADALAEATAAGGWQ